MTLLDQLRLHTRTRHATLDAAIDVTARYPAFLQASLAALDELEPAIARWRPIAARREALRADLAELGAPAIPAVPLPFAPATPVEALGCAYVVEGSALGGAVLAKRVADQPTRYLRIGGAWKSFAAELAAHAADDRACALACATFDHYAAAFRAAGVLAS